MTGSNTETIGSSLCTNPTKQQSPIMLPAPANANETSVSTDLKFYYRTSRCNITKSRHHIVLDYDTGSYIIYNGDIFELEKISFSVPSEHTIKKGQSSVSAYPIEVQLNHRCPSSGALLIISNFLEINPAQSPSVRFLDYFKDNMPNPQKPSQRSNMNTPDSWNAFNLFKNPSAGMPFYTYKGSITRFPCTEDVIRIIMHKPSNCTDDFYNKLVQASGTDQNARATQAQKAETVVNYTNNNNPNNTRNYGSKLRCYNETQFRNACSKLTNYKDIVNAKHRQLMLMVSTASILILLVLFILWLVQQDFFTKTWDATAGWANMRVFGTDHLQYTQA